MTLKKNLLLAESACLDVLYVINSAQRTQPGLLGYEAICRVPIFEGMGIWERQDSPES